jgi:hypothetical protein
MEAGELTKRSDGTHLLFWLILPTKHPYGMRKNKIASCRVIWQAEF